MDHNGDYFGKDFLFSSVTSSERLSTPVDKKINNFRNSINFHGEDRVVKLWCPSLVSTLKPAKR